MTPDGLERLKRRRDELEQSLAAVKQLIKQETSRLKAIAKSEREEQTK